MDTDAINLRDPKTLKELGFSQLAGPFYRKENEMLKRFVSEAKRANKKVAFSGTQSRIELWQKRNAA
jgi:hypothetical protein